MQFCLVGDRNGCPLGLSSIGLRLCLLIESINSSSRLIESESAEFLFSSKDHSNFFKMPCISNSFGVVASLCLIEAIRPLIFSIVKSLLSSFNEENGAGIFFKSRRIIGWRAYKISSNGVNEKARGDSPRACGLLVQT